MVHPLMVTDILADMNMDMACLQTGLLHDVVEDTGAGIEEIRKAFGDEVARCVDGVTKLSKISFYSAEARQAESFRKMLLAMVTDIRVIIVKLADRVHNLRTLGSLPPERQEHVAREPEQRRADTRRQPKVLLEYIFSPVRFFAAPPLAHRFEDAFFGVEQPV